MRPPRLVYTYESIRQQFTPVNHEVLKVQKVPKVLTVLALKVLHHWHSQHHLH